ncbi:MAG TPA: STAS domain-containing protein [Solirubrobacteraceae bacterium]|nr:STAS domain-containing protein [Solirubrobacteraceae bacterium]
MSPSIEGDSRGWYTPARHALVHDVVSRGEHVLRVGGELDVAYAPVFEAAIVKICRLGARVVTLDLRELTFIDSAGLGAVLFARKECARLAVEFRIIPGRPATQRIFELLGLRDELDLEPADDAAGT